MAIPAPTVEELVQTLARSTIVTILVEGSTDSTVYSLMERRFSLPRGSVLPCFGRDALLATFLRRAEFAKTKCVFVADRDMWLFVGTPVEYSDVVFTSGYSIENDVLDGPAVERLLSPDEFTRYEEAVRSLCEWFTVEAQKAIDGQPCSVDISVHQLLVDGTDSLRPEYRAGPGQLSSVLYSRIRDNYRLLLRGKQLVDCLVRYLSARSRWCKYSKGNVLEVAASSPEHATLAVLANAITQRIA